MTGKIAVGCSIYSVSGEECEQILEYPSTDGAVVRQNDDRHHPCQESGRSELFVQHTVSGKRSLFGLASHGNLRDQQGKTKGQCKNDVYEDEGTSAILSCQIRKTPNISKTYSTSGCGHNKAQRASKAAALMMM